VYSSLIWSLSSGLNAIVTESFVLACKLAQAKFVIKNKKIAAFLCDFKSINIPLHFSCRLGCKAQQVYPFESTKKRRQMLLKLNFCVGNCCEMLGFTAQPTCSY
jgi:hypothetical protein